MPIVAPRRAKKTCRKRSLHFDWVYRLRAIYDILGLAPTEGMLSRQRRLRELADLIRNGTSTASVRASAPGA